MPWFAVGQLWGVDELETENAVTELESWHLIDVDWTERTISLIDLHLDYLRASAKADLAQWQAGLLQRCGRRKLGVNEGREDDSYWGQDGQRHVLHHLTGCEPTAFSTEIVEVQLNGLRIRSEGAMELARMLPQSKIARLECAMGLEPAPESVFAFVSRPADRKANTFCAHRLDYNELGPGGGAALAEGLKGNSTLQSLS